VAHPVDGKPVFFSECVVLFYLLLSLGHTKEFELGGRRPREPRTAGAQLKPRLFFSLRLLGFGWWLRFPLFLPLTRSLDLNHVRVVGQTVQRRRRQQRTLNCAKPH
jgi:hypothetical protein